MEKEAELEIEQIEELVGLDDGSCGAAASILEGLVDWEDYVDPGFEKEKKRWFELNQRLSSLERLKAAYPARR